MGTESLDEAEDGWDGGDRLLHQITESYVLPELKRRRASGAWDEHGLVERAVVILGGARAGSVLLNGEVRGVLTIKAGRPITAGEDVAQGDIRSVEAFDWEGDDGATSYVALVPTHDGMALVTEFRGNVLESAPHVDAAEEFLLAALDALQNHRVRVFLDLSYSAAELMAKGELLRWAGSTVSGTKSHSRVLSAYNAWAKLDNTEPRFAALLNRLNELRGPARYLDRDTKLIGDELDSIADELQEMFRHVREVAPRPGVDPEPKDPRPLKFVARRDLRAGELLGSDDVSPFASGRRR